MKDYEVIGWPDIQAYMDLEGFKDIPEIEMKPVPVDTKPNYWLSTMLLKEDSKVTPLNVIFGILIILLYNEVSMSN